MIQRIPLKRLMLVPVLGMASVVSACGGYVWVKRSEYESKPKVVVDSSQVMALREQLAALETKYKADSSKYANTPVKVVGVPDSVVRSRDAEIAALKDQLAKATAELDRIKRRLATPRS